MSKEKFIFRPKEIIEITPDGEPVFAGDIREREKRLGNQVRVALGVKKIILLRGMLSSLSLFPEEEN